jgi:hypothetical protein
MTRALSRASLVDNRGVAKPVPKPKRARKRSAGARILNRELSALALHQRALDLASDREQPLLERVPLLLDRLEPARRVLIDPSRRPPRPSSVRYRHALDGWAAAARSTAHPAAQGEATPERAGKVDE